MLNNKRFNIVLSLIIAICIWGYVIGETNPTDSKIFREIPISLINEETLQDNGLAVLEVSDSTMNVTLTGTRADMSKVSAKDIVATVDLADAAKGENELRVDIRIPDDVELEDKSLNKVTVVVEENRSKKIDIKVDYRGTFAEDEEPVTVKMSRKTTVVSGPASQVEKVAYARAVVGAGKVTDEPKAIKCNLIPVNKAGTQVKTVNLSAGSVSVTAELARTKTVPLNVPIVDNGNELYERSISVPEEVTIKGKSSDLKNIDSVTTQTVNISDITENATIPLTPILPKDVQVSSKSAESLVMVVTVQQPTSRSFTFDSGDIELIGLGNDLNADVKAERITVTLIGKKEDIDAISKSDIKLTASLQNLQEGSHQVELQAECSGVYSELNVEPRRIRVVIE